jgi:ABC-type dipeptide/oligopeptide/nickel transport system permease subunit
MLQAGFQNILSDPILGTVPGIAVVITGLAFSLIGDGLTAEFGKP